MACTDPHELEEIKWEEYWSSKEGMIQLEMQEDEDDREEDEALVHQSHSTNSGLFFLESM